MFRSFAIAALIAWSSACAAVSLPAASAGHDVEWESARRDAAAAPVCTSSGSIEAAPELAASKMTASNSGLAPASERATADRSAASHPMMYTALANEIEPAPAGSAPWLQVPVQQPKKSRPRWLPGQSKMQGFFGAQEMTEIKREGGSSPDVNDSGDTIMPVLGGGAQWKLSGEKIDFGLEGMVSFAWQSNGTAVVATGAGSAVVAVDFGLFLMDLYGGPFVNLFLGDRVRVYAAAGPIFEFASYDQNSAFFDDSGTGFGFGGYARTGLEFMLASSTMLGVGFRWSQTTVDLGSDLGDLDLEGLQFAITVTTGF